MIEYRLDVAFQALGHPTRQAMLAGRIEHATFRIGDQILMAIDSPPVHEFDFTPSLSLFVSCESEEEIDRLFAGLSEGGFVMMPLSAEYPFAARYAWLSDRFGVSWQLLGAWRSKSGPRPCSRTSRRWWDRSVPTQVSAGT